MSTDDKTLTLGIWLRVFPYVTLRGEGIYRLLLSLMRAAQARADLKIVVAIPRWAVPDLMDLLCEHGIPAGRLEIMSSRHGVPFLIRLRRYLERRRPRGKPALGSFLERIAAALWNLPVSGSLMRGLLSTDSYVVAGLLLLVLLPVSVVLLPLVLLAPLMRRVISASGVGRLQRAFEGFWHLSGETLRNMRGKWMGAITTVYEGVIEHEFDRLARKASRRRDVQVWFVPYPGSVNARLIRAPLVVAVPDLVYLDFPSTFDTRWACKVDREIRDVTHRAAATVSYSEYVRDRHVVEHLGVDRARTRVIPHAPLACDQHLAEALRTHDGDMRRAAASVIRDYLKDAEGDLLWSPNIPPEYLTDFPFDEVDFLFVSSQIRPSKNYMNLFRAYETVLRRHYRNVKLVTTGRLKYESSGIQDFVKDRHLELDILSIPNMPSDVHAAFFHLAALTVVPTFFEGGFPFPFSESLSVGTPVIMSSIPVTREVVPPELAKVMLFDPYDVEDMTGRILWALDHRRELLEQQRPFAEQLKRRTWKQVADEYLAVFQGVASAHQAWSAK